MYSDYIERNHTSGRIAGLQRGQVTAAFRSFSAPLAAQDDFTQALAASRDIVDAARDKLLSAHHGAPLSALHFVWDDMGAVWPSLPRVLM